MRLRVTNGWAVSVLLASVGCGQTRGVSDTGSGAAGASGIGDEPVEMALDFAQSGSRLIAMGYSSNEARVFRTFHDSKLGFDCNFVPEAEGAFQRCVPNMDATIVYTDAGCSEPAAWDRWTWGQDAWEAGDVVSSVPGGAAFTCPGEVARHRDVYRVAERLTEEMIGQPDPPLFSQANSSCQPASAPAKVTPPVYRLVPMSETELVRAELVSLNLGGGLRLRRLVAEDGAALNWGVTGDDRTPCAFQRDGECVPEPIARPSTPPGVGNDGRFWSALNADCSEPAFGTPYSPACGVPRFGVQDDGVAPPKVVSLTNASTLFQLEYVIPFTDPETYVCTARTGDLAGQAAVPDDDLTGTLPSAGQLQRGSGPLRVNWYSRGQSELLPVLADFQRASPGFLSNPEFVTDTGLPCQITPADDGTERCVVADDTSHSNLATAPEVVWGPL